MYVSVFLVHFVIMTFFFSFYLLNFISSFSLMINTFSLFQPGEGYFVSLSIGQTKKDSLIIFLTYFVFQVGRSLCILSLYYLMIVSMRNFYLFFPSWEHHLISTLYRFLTSFFSFLYSFPLYKRPQKTVYNSIFHTQSEDFFRFQLPQLSNLFIFNI